MTFVGMYAETSPSCVSIIGRAVKLPPPFSSESFVKYIRLKVVLEMFPSEKIVFRFAGNFRQLFPSKYIVKYVGLKYVVKYFLLRIFVQRNEKKYILKFITNIDNVDPESTILNVCFSASEK